MRAGLLTERLTFLKQTQIASATGERKKDWSPVYSCKAYKHKSASIMDRDGLNAKEQFNGYNIVFQVRFNPLIEDTQRVQYRDRLYRIIPPLDYQPDRTYIITLTRVDE